MRLPDMGDPDLNRPDPAEFIDLRDIADGKADIILLAQLQTGNLRLPESTGQVLFHPCGIPEPERLHARSLIIQKEFHCIPLLE